MQFNASPDTSAKATALQQSFDAINIKESEDLAYWVHTLGVSEAQLRIAVATVGVQVDDVRNHFGVLRTAG